MYVSTRVGRRTRVGFRHGGFFFLLLGLAALAILPWLVILGLVVGVIWLCAAYPSVSAQFIGGFFVFSIFVGLPTFVITLLTAHGTLLWAVPVAATALASAVYAAANPKQRKEVTGK